MNKISTKYIASRLVFVVALFVVGMIGSFAFAGHAEAAQTLPATDISNTSVTLNGIINPQGLDTTFWFEYGTSYSLGQITTQKDAGSPVAQINVYNTVYGLAPNTTYYFRVDAQNSSGGYGQGDILSFQTGSNGGCNNGCNGGGLVNTGSAQPAGSSELLNGDVNPQGANTQVSFRYGQSSGSLNLTTNVALAYGTTQQNFSAYAQNLISGATYYYQAVAQGQYGTNYGQVLSFVAPYNSGNPGIPNNPSGQVPSVSTNGASSIGRTSATMNASVNPNGSLSAVWFEYGRTTALGGVTTRDPAGSGNSQVPYSGTVNGLAAGTTYYYRAVAQSPSGTNDGQIMSFRTAAAPVVPTPVPTPTPTTPVTPTPSGNGGGTNTVPGSTVPVVPAGAPGCFTVSPTISAPQLTANQDFTYSATYRNNCGYALSNASLQVTLPAAVDFAGTNYPFLTRDGNVITYNLGVIAPNFQAAVTVSGKVKAQVNNGDSLVFQANLAFTDPQGAVQSASGYLTAMIVNSAVVPATGSATSSTLGASVSDNLSSLFHSGWFWLVLFLILLALFVFWLATRRRDGEDEEEIAPAH